MLRATKIWRDERGEYTKRRPESEKPKGFEQMKPKIFCFDFVL